VNQSVTLRTTASAFQALADPTRRAVLDQLRAGPQPAGKIADAFPMSRPAVSKHLRVLAEAELVVTESHGRHRYYHLNADPLRGVDAWLAGYRHFWGARLTNLKSFVESSPAPSSRSASGRGRASRLTGRKRRARKS
jgi:DNA-binding transcriptional ArsR family regulator